MELENGTPLTNLAKVIRTVIYLTLYVLKMSGAVDWSWWIIFMPLWVPFVFGFIGVLVVFLKN